MSLITITSLDGRSRSLAASAIAEIVDPPPSSAWHGCRAHVKLFDGRWIEACETRDDIERQLMEQMR
ncbi:hypothetical protein [Breoghania sp.]|uniref:hypothetical protein n=1 Tax=Breoghania sp. TaxID=2065378 RepID=UPI0029CA6DBB|nr:hypothetical protein [Breoghania sp.]